MYDAQGRYISPSRAFSKQHYTGMWHTRTIIDFPSARPARPKAAEPRPASKDVSKDVSKAVSKGAVRGYDIESLLAEVAELGAMLSPKPRTPGEIRQFPRKPQVTP